MKGKIENKNNFSPIQTKLAGVTFGNCQANIRQWGCADFSFYEVRSKLSKLIIKVPRSIDCFRGIIGFFTQIALIN
jgi:hypothetical protein